MGARHATHPGSARARGGGSLFGVAAAILATVLVAGGPSAAASSVAAPAATGSTAVRTAPIGATGSVDDDAWLIAERLAAPSYTPDATEALVAGLARSGIGTYADASSLQPEMEVVEPASPLHLLDFQVHSLAVGVWTGSTLSGAELDAMLPTPAQSAVMPSTSDVLAAYVAAADSPGASLSRAILAGQDLLSPASVRFPAVVMVLFASDLATDGGRLEVPSAATVGGFAGSSAAAHAAGLGATGGVCTDTANWINGTIHSLFNALRLATPNNLPGVILVSIWNWLVTQGEAFVQGLLSAVTDAVLGTVRSIAGTIAAVAEQVASMVPYGVQVRAASETGGGTFTLGSDPQSGTYTASVSAGDLPDWPAVLVDCAKAADVALADFHAKNLPLTWGPLDAPANPLLAPTSAARTYDTTDANGQASWPFTVSTDPGDPNGEQQNQVDAMPVTVHRPEVQAARDHLTTALLGFVPGILQPFVASLFAPYISGLQARLNALLDARGRGTAFLVFHAGVKPTPSVPPTPGPSGACSPNPVAPGSYTGTITNISSEVIDLGVSGGIVDHTSGTGSATVAVAADGSASGTWDMIEHDVFEETANVDGVPSLKDHRESTITFGGGTVTGTACNLGLMFGTIVMTSCLDSLKGDCTGEQPPFGSSPAPTGLGPPASVSGGHVTWTLHYASDGDAKVTDDLTVAVSIAAP